jgi:hypothetical protein
VTKDIAPTSSLGFNLPIGVDEVLTTDELAKRLTHLTPEAARQAVSRASRKGDIWRSNHLKLPAGGRLCARKFFAGQERFLQQIRPLLVAERPGICRVLDEMLRVPAISEETMLKLLAATSDPEKYSEQRSFKDEMKVLAELGIVEADGGPGARSRFVRPRLRGTPESEKLGHELAARRLLDGQLTKLLLQTFKSQNVVSWGFEPDADDEHLINGQWFSAYGFSWLRPLQQTEKKQEPKPCLTVFDVRSTAATVVDVQAFAARIKNAGYRPRSKQRILGVMGARFFESGAFDLGKKHGFVLVNFQSQIGDAALDALASIDAIVSGEPGSLTTTDSVIDLFSKLRNHPQAKELASLAFECFAAAVSQANSWSGVHTNFAVKFGKEEAGTWRDVDVMGQQGDHHLAIECKAYARTKELEVSDVTKFFKQTVPSFLKHYAQLKPVRRLTAQLWTTGQITEDCRKKLNEIAAGASPTHSYALVGEDDIIIPSAVKSLKNLLTCIAEL